MFLLQQSNIEVLPESYQHGGNLKGVLALLLMDLEKPEFWMQFHLFLINMHDLDSIIIDLWLHDHTVILAQ